MRWFLIMLVLTGSAMAQSAPAPQSVNKIVAECNKQSGQYQLWLGQAQEINEGLQDQIKAAQMQIAELTKKLAETTKPLAEKPKAAPPPN